jgi:glycosyltransferase involved in cell wall biosynthesis
MLRKAGHEVFLYHASSIFQSGIADKTVQVVDDDTMSSRYGSRFYETFNQSWGMDDAAWLEFRRKASLSLAKNLTSDGDIVLASFGLAHQQCCPSPSSALTIEMGIGYEGVFAQRKVWESYAWRHFVYGKYPSLQKDFDVVIPGYFDSADFQFNSEKKGYLLYLGRVVEEKGIIQAVQAAKLAGVKLKIAGSGDPEWIKENCGDAEYLGVVDVAQRRKLLSDANGLVAFTRYVEPFGNVAVEAMASGTPVIASDYGAFTETVLPGKTGFRCSDVPQLAEAMKKVMSGAIPSLNCSAFAQNFSIEKVWPRYEEYFRHQHNLFSIEFGYAK